jgi:hypothetical protein
MGNARAPTGGAFHKAIACPKIVILCPKALRKTTLIIFG